MLKYFGTIGKTVEKFSSVYTGAKKVLTSVKNLTKWVEIIESTFQHFETQYEEKFSKPLIKKGGR